MALIQKDESNDPAVELEPLDEKEDESYFNFINSIKSEVTKANGPMVFVNSLLRHVQVQKSILR
jgi:hypothetical protein